MDADPLALARQYADVTQVQVARRGRRLLKGAVSRVARVATYPQSIVNTTLIDVLDEVAERQRQLEHDLGEVNGDLRAAMSEAVTGADLRAIAAEQLPLQRAIERLAGDVEAIATRLAGLEAVLPTLIARLDGVELAALDQGQVSSSNDDGSVALYYALEEAFRGEEAAIRDRLEPYVEVLAGAVGPVVDLGAGRGELLDVCRANDIEAYGVDLVEANVARCRAKGHRAERTDAVAHLRSLPDGGVGAVTAIHLAEHLPPSALIALAQEAARVIEPGGVLIVETPNCENLAVGASSFWLDPTHVRPVHPLYLEFLAEHVGFASVELRRLEREPVPVPDIDAIDDPVLRRVGAILNARLGAASDVALVARQG